jgi:Asp-tRNAAsn/Glu-tRNAGln amidotransferase A subunit and related amidases
VAIVPEVPGGATHPAQAAAVRLAGKHLRAAGYVVEEVLPPDMERGVELWHMICVTDVFAGCGRRCRRWATPDGIASMKGWLEIHKPVDLPTYVAALTEREGLLLRWMTFFQQWPLLVLPTLADLPPKQVADVEPGGPGKHLLASMRPASSPLCSACPALPCRSAATASCAPACRSWPCATARISASTPAK